MISARRTALHPIRGIVVDETSLPPRWHCVDLPQLRSRLGLRRDGRVGGPSATPIRVSAWLGDTRPSVSPDHRADVAAACVVIGADRRRRGIPLDSFVVIGRDAALPRPAAPSANDNAPAGKAPRPMRLVLREVVLLAMLAASLVGAFYSGRMHASQNVIVVPPPSSPRNALT